MVVDAFGSRPHRVACHFHHIRFVVPSLVHLVGVRGWLLLVLWACHESFTGSKEIAIFLLGPILKQGECSWEIFHRPYIPLFILFLKFISFSAFGGSFHDLWYSHMFQLSQVVLAHPRARDSLKLNIIQIVLARMKFPYAYSWRWCRRLGTFEVSSWTR